MKHIHPQIIKYFKENGCCIYSMPNNDGIYTISVSLKNTHPMYLGQYVAEITDNNELKYYNLFEGEGYELISESQFLKLIKLQAFI